MEHFSGAETVSDNTEPAIVYNVIQNRSKIETCKPRSNQEKANMIDEDIKYKVYNLREALIELESKSKIIDGFHEFLIEVFRENGLILKTIIFEDVEVEIQDDLFEFRTKIGSLTNLEVNRTESLEDYQLFIAKSLNVYLCKTVKSVKPWTEYFKFTIPPNILTKLPTIKVKESHHYSDIHMGDLRGKPVFLKPAKSDVKILNISKEAFLHLHLSHKNIMRCYGIFEHNSKEFLVFDQLPALYQASQILSTKSESEKLKSIVDLGQGLSFMHMKGILLMNLSP